MKTNEELYAKAGRVQTGVGNVRNDGLLGHRAGRSCAIMTVMKTLNVALKEWDLVFSAMLAGRQAVLLRKGGILEADNQFELEHERFLFFPTYVHQDPRMTKAAFRGEIRTMAAEPTEVELRGHGEAAAIFEVPGRKEMDALFDLHPWDTPLIDMRFAYRPEKPLYLVVVRAFVLVAPVRIANTLEYAGCKSWVPLMEGVEVEGSRQAVGEETLEALIERVKRTFGKA